MEYRKIFGLILDLGAAMIGCGGETRRVTTAVYMLAESYGFENVNFWVVPSTVQGTVTSPDGEVFSEIRHIHGTSTDFGQLDALNSLSRKVVGEKPDAEEFAGEFAAVSVKKKPRAFITYLAGILGVIGFAGFFGCDFMDILVVAAASLLITFAVRRLSGRESNPLILNLAVSMLSEFFIITCVHLGFGHHVGLITASVVMMLISGLAATNGIRDLIHLDPLSGISNITLSVTGALGIALGIAVPLYALRAWVPAEAEAAQPGAILLLVFAVIICLGFALWFGVKGRRLAACALGGVLMVGAYLAASSFISSNFLCRLIAAAFCCVYSQIMARVEKAPATIFVTIGVLPLAPGSSLYQMMHGLVSGDKALAASGGTKLLSTAFGIVMGLMIVEAGMKYVLGAAKLIKKKKR